MKNTSSPPGPKTLTAGIAAMDFVLLLPQLIPSVKTITFVVYSPSASFEERLLSTHPNVSFLRNARALLDSEKTDNVFAELLQLELWKANSSIEIIEEALAHNSAIDSNEHLEIEVEQLTYRTFENIIRQISSDQAIGINSRCILKNGTTAHIPMMDFRCPASPNNTELLATVLKRISPGSGVILKSGRSYHFYSLQTMSDSDWIRFMGRCLLLSPITDNRYIAHRLIEGTATLRLTGSLRKPYAPQVIQLL